MKLNLKALTKIENHFYPQLFMLENPKIKHEFSLKAHLPLNPQMGTFPNC